MPPPHSPSSEGTSESTSNSYELPTHSPVSDIFEREIVSPYVVPELTLSLTTIPFDDNPSQPSPNGSDSGLSDGCYCWNYHFLYFFLF